MSDLLQTIKDQIVQEIGDWKDWYEFKVETEMKAKHEYMMNAVCKRYAFEVAKASLNNAWDKAELIHCGRTMKESILDESNIKL